VYLLAMNKKAPAGTGAVERMMEKNLTSFPVICKLYFLLRLIPADGFFEPELSLAIDRAVIDLEAA
jgi:hypothetical protein